LTCKSFTSSQ